MDALSWRSYKSLPLLHQLTNWLLRGGGESFSYPGGSRSKNQPVLMGKACPCHGGHWLRHPWHLIGLVDLPLMRRVCTPTFKCWNRSQIVWMPSSWQSVAFPLCIAPNRGAPLPLTTTTTIRRRTGVGLAPSGDDIHDDNKPFLAGVANDNTPASPRCGLRRAASRLRLLHDHCIRSTVADDVTVFLYPINTRC